MKDRILKDLEEIFNIHEDMKIEFIEICGFTFVFITRIFTINEQLSSAEIKPVGIIYEENDQYYFAPLYDVDNLEEIVKEFVKTF